MPDDFEVMPIFTVAIVAGLVFFAMMFGAIAFGTYQSNQTERACIAAGRVIWNGHCAEPAKPGEIRIQNNVGAP